MTLHPHPVLPILLIDDEAAWLHSFELTLRAAGITNVLRSQDSREVMPLLAHTEIAVVVLDLSMPFISGEELLATIGQEYPEVPVIIVTGMNQVDAAVRCMKSGAFDYYVKTVEVSRLVAGVQRATEVRELRRENTLLRERFLNDELAHPEIFEPIVTQDKSMRAAFHYVEAISPTSQPVLISGESGTGKELIAQAVHRASGRAGEFVRVNVAGLDDTLFSDTLFGHKRGAFTGADTTRIGLVSQAADGTLFLDEIGDLSPQSQVKLLRLLQDGEYFPLGSDVPRLSSARVIAATNQNLNTLQKSGIFRKDLYHRLHTHHVHLPPLRDRPDDIPLLLDHFLKQSARALNKKCPTPPKEIYTFLSNYAFPGNVRELMAMVFDAVSQHHAKILSMDVFKAHIRTIQPAPGAGTAETKHSVEAPVTFGRNLPTLKEATRLLVAEAVRRAGGNQSQAAEMLGVTRQALNWRLKKGPGDDHLAGTVTEPPRSVTTKHA